MLETLERLILDPISELPPYQVLSNRPLEITGLRTPSPEGHGVFLVEHSYPRPDATPTFASSRDSQGEARFGKPKLANRKIPIKAYVTEAMGVGAMTNLVTNPAGEGEAKMAPGANYPTTRELGNASVPAIAGEFRDRHAFVPPATSTIVGTFPVTFPAAGTYVVSAFVWVPTAWDGGAPRLLSSGTYVGSSAEVAGSADMTKRAQWQRISTKITVVAGDLVGTFGLDCTASPSSAATGVLFSEALQAESGSAPSPWAYGDTPACSWNGTPNASTSTRYGSGSDRKRFLRSLYDLQEKIEKLAEEGGTLKRVLPDGSWMVFDVVEAEFQGNWEKRFNQGQEEFGFELICKPGARLEPVVLEAHEEKTLPFLTFTELKIPGNMPALGDLLIEDKQGVDRKFAAIALASRYLDTSANAEPFYEAETRLRLGAAALAAGAGIPSGIEANKVVSVTLGNTYSPFLSTRASGGSYTSHVGAQHLFARVLTSTAVGIISVRAEFAQGDLLRWKQLPAFTIQPNAYKNEWQIIDLGIVRLNRAIVGIQRWEGRLTAKSSAPIGYDSLQCDWIGILPVEEFYGEARALTIPPGTVGSQIASDGFTGSEEVVLTGLEGNLGGKWASVSAGSIDFKERKVLAAAYRETTAAQVDVSSTANDAPVPRASPVTGRWLRLGTGVQADVSVSAALSDGSSRGMACRSGVFARYTDMNNLVMARWVHLAAGVNGETEPAADYLEVWKKLEGTWSLLGSVVVSGVPVGGFVGPSISFHVGADGSGYGQLYQGSKVFGAVSWLPSASLATGGKLATGGYGIHGTVSAQTGSSAIAQTMSIASFNVYAGADAGRDAVIYANRKMRLRWDKTVRESEDGSGAFPEVGLWEGDRLLIPQSGRELRPMRMTIMALREPPGAGPDLQADDLKATLTITPRTIEVPKVS